MGKGLGFIVVILIWGGLIFFLFNTPLLSELSGGDFFGSGLLSFNGVLSEQKGIIDVLGGSQGATVHFSKKIDIWDIEVSPEDSNLIFAASNSGLFISRDAGLNWYNFSDVEHKINSNGAIYKILFNNLKGNSSEKFLSVFRNDKGIIYESRDNFFSLEKIFEIDKEAIYDFETDGNDLYLGLSDGRLLILSLANNEIRVLNTFDSAISGLEIIPKKELIYLTLKSGGFFLSRDMGQSFVRLEFLDDYRGADKVNDFWVGGSDASLVYAATDYGLIRSFNAGNTWQVFKSLPSEEKKTSALAVKEDSGEIFVSSNGKIYQSQDFGSNWRTVENGFKNREISIIKLIDGKIIAGSRKN